MDQTWKLLSIAAGGAIGALSRYGLAHAMNKRWHDAFPYGTLTANLVGAFLIGLLFTLFSRLQLPDRWEPLIFIGFLGALTTFSTFTFEIHSMIDDGRYTGAAVYWLSSNALGIAMVYLGVAIGRQFGATPVVVG